MYSTVKYLRTDTDSFPQPGFRIVICVQVKGKAIPLQAWAGPEGSRRLRLPDFKTMIVYREIRIKTFLVSLFLSKK